jgi:hypothetical protein
MEWHGIVPRLWAYRARIAFDMEVAMTRRTRNLHWLVWTAVVAGCAQWSTPPSSELANLPLPKLAPDSVVLEVTFIRIPEERVDFEERFWPEADESALNTELRRRMAANGFRGGLVGTPPPPALQELLDSHSAPDLGDGVTRIEAGAEIAVRTHRLRNRAGHPGKIIVRGTPVFKLAALAYDENGRVHGESLEQAQFYFSITSRPQGDGQVRIELVPTIEHGQPRSRFKGQQGAWTVDNVSRATKTYDDLKIDTLLSPGQSVAIGCSNTLRGLGEQFFAADSEEREPRLLLIVRLQQTQLDERFMTDETLEPITTVID